MQRSWKIRATVLLGILILCWSGCSFKEPLLPAIETTVSIPFLIQDFIVGDSIVAGADNFIIKQGEPDSIIWFSLLDTLELQTIDADDFAFQPESSMESIELDTIRVDQLENLIAPELTMGVMVPGLDQLVGQTATIPQLTASGFLPIPALKFERVHFISGRVRLRVTNNLPVVVGGNDGTAGLSLSITSDSFPNDPFAEFFFEEEIAPNSVAVREVRVADRWLYAPMRLDYALPIARDTTLQITNDIVNAGISIEIELVNVKADEIVADIESQKIEHTVRFSYDDSTTLRSASVRSGRISLNFSNSLSIPAVLSITVPAIRNTFDEPLQRTFTIPGQGSSLQPFVLDGMRIVNANSPGDLIERLEVMVSAGTKPTGGFVSLKTGDSFSVEMSSTNLVFDSFSGVFTEEILDISPATQQDVVDYEGFDGIIALDQVLLNITVFSQVSIENLVANLDITAYRRDDQGVRTDSTTFVLQEQNINGGLQGGDLGVTTIRLNSDDYPGLLDLINLLPNEFNFQGQIRASGNVTVSLGDSIWAHYQFETPLRMHIDEEAVFESKEDSLTTSDIDQEIQNLAEKDLLSARMNFLVTNSMPIGAELRFVMAADLDDPDIFDDIYEPNLNIIRIFNIDEPQVDPQSGFVSSPQVSEVTIQLSQEEIQLFQSPPLRYGFVMKLSSSGGYVTLRRSDFVRIAGDVQVVLRIDDEE